MKENANVEASYAVGFFVFLIVAVFSYLPNVLPHIARWMTLKYVGEKSDEQELRNQVSCMRKDLRSINMADEFAKYAKLERKIIKVSEQVKKYEKERSDVMNMVKIGLIAALHILKALLTAMILWSYKSYPVVKFDSYTFMPVSSLVAFPSGVEGSIGIVPWLLICRIVVTKGPNIIQNVPTN